MLDQLGAAEKTKVSGIDGVDAGARIRIIIADIGGEVGTGDGDQAEEEKQHPFRLGGEQGAGDIRQDAGGRKRQAQSLRQMP